MSIRDVAFYAVGEEGVQAGSGVSDLVISNASMEDLGEEGVQLGRDASNVLIEKLTVLGSAGEEGVDIGSDSRNVTIRRSRFEDIDEEGVSISWGGRNLVIENVTMRNVGVDDPAIDISPDTTFTIRNVTIENVINGDALRFLVGGQRGTVDDVRILGAIGGSVIVFDGPDTVVTGSGNSFEGTFGGVFCSDAGGNPGSRIEFVDGSTCP